MITKLTLNKAYHMKFNDMRITFFVYLVFMKERKYKTNKKTTIYVDHISGYRTSGGCNATRLFEPSRVDVFTGA